MPTLPGFANLNGNADDLTTTKQGPDATAYADDENGAYTSSETEDEEPQQQPAGLASTSMPISNQAAIMPLPIHAPSQAPIPGASMRDPAHERKDSATSPDKKYSTETAETGVVASTSARKDGKDKSIQPLLLYVCEGCFKYFIHMPVYSFHLVRFIYFWMSSIPFDNFLHTNLVETMQSQPSSWQESISAWRAYDLGSRRSNSKSKAAARVHRKRIHTDQKFSCSVKTSACSANCLSTISTSSSSHRASYSTSSPRLGHLSTMSWAFSARRKSHTTTTI